MPMKSIASKFGTKEETSPIEGSSRDICYDQIGIRSLIGIKIDVHEDLVVTWMVSCRNGGASCGWSRAWQAGGARHNCASGSAYLNHQRRINVIAKIMHANDEPEIVLKDSTCEPLQFNVLC